MDFDSIELQELIMILHKHDKQLIKNQNEDNYNHDNQDISDTDTCVDTCTSKYKSRWYVTYEKLPYIYRYIPTNCDMISIQCLNNWCMGTSQKRNRRVVTFSPLKGTTYKSPPKKKRRQPVWTQKELCSLVEFVALHKDLQSFENEWPAMNADNVYWTKASDFIKQTCGSVRNTISCRAKIVNHFRMTYLTIAEAEEEFAINYEESTSIFDDSGFIETPKTSATPATSHSVDHFVEYYLSKFSQDHVVSIWQKLIKKITDSQLIQSLKPILNEDQMVKLINTSSVDFAEQLVKANFQRLSLETKKQCLDQMFQSVAEEEGLKIETARFNSISLSAMKTLKDNDKPNLVKDFVKCLGTTRPNSQEPLMPVTRMPFGLIQHQIQFFCASDIRQVIYILILPLSLIMEASLKQKRLHQCHVGVQSLCHFITKD
ncbi:unnamed protein product [Mytilus coruscus]|uniref:Myb-like domain-containing protein n=1 Tax=Mytilus coruscus TaxID=42192 RepID=A0A6J8B190_MYTCO|nr:unnamed protein product [Mytilus coruscus]